MNKFLLLSISAFIIAGTSCTKKTPYTGFKPSSTPMYVKHEDPKSDDSIIEDSETSATSRVENTSERPEPAKLPELDKEVIKENKVFYDKMVEHKNNIKALKENKELSKKDLKKARKKEMKALKKDIKKEMKVNQGDDSKVALIVLSVILAPIGLGLLYGWGSFEFWIGLVLILLFWFPAAIYGLIKSLQYYE